MITELNAKQIRDNLDDDHWSARLLAEIVCSSYWGGAGVDLRELDRLDTDNWRQAVAIMGYRRTPGWDDAEFYALACWCRTRHHLAQWGKAE